jgi:RND superfamily putative drug exporter
LSSLTRWVLAHKRIVVVAWLLLTVAGIAAAGPASKALDQRFSVPGKEGWETNVAIAERYAGTGGDTAPLLRWSRCRRARRSPARACAAR